MGNGGGRPAFPLTLDPVALKKLLHASETGMNTLIDLKVRDHAELDGKTVLVRELQRDPLGPMGVSMGDLLPKLSPCTTMMHV